MRMSDDLATCDAACSVSRIPGRTSTSRVVAVGNVGRVAGPVAVARVVLAGYSDQRTTAFCAMTVPYVGCY
jgi:hypothetical protein